MGFQIILFLLHRRRLRTNRRNCYSLEVESFCLSDVETEELLRHPYKTILQLQHGGVYSSTIIVLVSSHANHSPWDFLRPKAHYLLSDRGRRLNHSLSLTGELGQTKNSLEYHLP